MTKKLNITSVGQGRDLVLLHGWGLNSAAWQGVLPLLESYFTVHLIDLPGFGESEPFALHTLQNMAQAVLDQAPTEAVWVGWSLGGLVATQAALMSPDRVRRLVTVASSPKFSQDQDWPGIQPRVLQQFIDSLAGDFKTTIERFLAVQAMGSESARQDIKALKTWLAEKPLPDPKALADGLTILQQDDLRTQLGGLEMPFLAMFGKLDRLVPIDVAQQVTLLAPDSEIYVFEKASHAPFVTDKEQFSAQLIHFCLV
ncbi:pimeloyl-ACP methyl ester esterase BioH [Motilimonas cestriensis]|uniref:Pimeloyl-[acyl-carrier protein] methyl ester esterase n=1 Tax=Motilimonas cestriensis TaxID=2742685 RepID=A0ABS8W9H2_9GAMM|nr:pimeloyl-ACP methyl ester esterase BioH [Motilimonas cestriensis]MCE2594747.1 pimeloyl-ACP methyl ester esterase BioH [Motilimonas cestriensis]